MIILSSEFFSSLEIVNDIFDVTELITWSLSRVYYKTETLLNAVLDILQSKPTMFVICFDEQSLGLVL